MFALTLSRRKRHPVDARQGYSLVELLFVLAILGTLMALLLMASMRVVAKTKRSAQYVSADSLRLAGVRDIPLYVPAPPAPKPEEVVDEKVIPDQYLIQFRASVADPQAEAQKLVAAYAGGKVLNVYNIPEVKGCNVFIPGVTAKALQGHPSVKSAEQNGRCYMCADNTPSGVRRISAINAGRRLQKVDPTSVGLPDVKGSLIRSTSGCVVAVMDTGVDKNHPDLNVTQTLAFGPFAPNGDDEQGHGTHVAGSIAAKINDQGVVGVFPGVEIWSIRVLDATGGGQWNDIGDALVHVRNNAEQIRVCNMSLGGGFVGFINVLVNACADAGVIMVVAAGNSADDSFFYSPASAAGAVCVAALADSDGRFGGIGPGTTSGGDDTFADFSNFGDVVDVIAPGVDIISTLPGNQYGSNSGTSMASPHIAGLMALYRSSVVYDQYGKLRPATGLEIASMYCQVHGAELIPGPSGGFGLGTRLYPLLVQPTKRP